MLMVNHLSVKRTLRAPLSSHLSPQGVLVVSLVRSPHYHDCHLAPSWEVVQISQLNRLLRTCVPVASQSLTSQSSMRYWAQRTPLGLLGPPARISSLYSIVVRVLLQWDNVWRGVCHNYNECVPFFIWLHLHF